VPSGPASAGGLNNSANDPSGAGNASKLSTAPGTNTLGTANASGSPAGSTVGQAGNGGSNLNNGTANRAGGATGGRIDGTVTDGPALPGDDVIRKEDAQDSKVDQKIKGICKGC
jgi:hypothetical protein